MLTIDLEKLEISNGSTILDLGCGKGRHLHKLYYFSKCHVIGLDLSIEELKIIKLHEDLKKDNQLQQAVSLLSGWDVMKKMFKNLKINTPDSESRISMK